MRTVCGLALLYLFSLGLASAADRAGLSSVSGWITGDFDGDRTADVAFSSTVGRDGSGYRQEVRVRFGESLQSVFAFHSRSARIQLRARDVDGDNDRDIVVMDGWSVNPIGVWLNDGTGTFSEGRLDRYQRALDTPNSKSVTAPQLETDSLWAVLDQDSQPDLPLACTAVAGIASESFEAEAVLHHPVRRAVRLRNRAPPCNR